MNPRIYISEYQKFAQDAHGRVVEMPSGAPVKNQSFNLTDRSQVSDPFDETATFIDISATAPFCIAFGDKPQAVPTMHRIAAGASYRHAIKPGEKIAFILSEDAMQPGFAMGGSASESLKNMIDVIADPKATKAAISELQKAEKSSQAAAKLARDAQNELADRQAALTAGEQAVAERELQLKNAVAKFENDSSQVQGDIANLAGERRAFVTEMQDARNALVAEQAAARTDIENRQTESERKLDLTLTAIAEQQTALETQTAQLQVREDSLKAREKDVTDREAAAKATEKALTAKLKQLKAAGIHVQSADEAETVTA